MTDKLIVSVSEERHPHAVVRTALARSAGNSAKIWFDISGDVLPPPLAVHDFAVLAALVVALREGRPLHIEGAVTETLLRNLEEFQEAWTMWWSKFRPVRITADEILQTTESPTRNGVFAMSGGVDATFALLRHHGGHAGLRTAHPVCSVMIHGFDIPLHKQQAFDRARESVLGMTKSFGIPLTTVRTNFREAVAKNWAMEYFVGVAACLHQFQGLANVAVVGASEDYKQLVWPCASNPVTNHLLSGGGFQLHTEGSGFTRTERVRLICDYPEIASKVRVCWEGPVTGANCGRCEKCIRTQLNFLANKREPACFDNKVTHRQILGLTARTPVQIEFLREIVASARKNGVDEPWVTMVRLAIAKSQLLRRIRGIETRLRGKPKSPSSTATSLEPGRPGMLGERK